MNARTSRGPLSEGIVSGNSVTCPLHNWVIGLDTGMAAEPDEGRTETIPVKLVDGEVYVGLLVERPCAVERPSSNGSAGDTHHLSLLRCRLRGDGR